MNRQRLLENFLQYVRVESTANPDASGYPSSPGQRELGRLLAEQLAELPLEDVHQDEHGLVWATIPATAGRAGGQAAGGPAAGGPAAGGQAAGGSGPATVALIAHLDTSPEAAGKNVRPQVIESYAGGDIELESGAKIAVDAAPELRELVGHTLITSDGTTLLGGDDKAGVAIIMELARHLSEHPELPHGPVKILFTCDEEIGRGTEKIDLQKLNATVAYTIDGGGAGELDVETFSADAMKVAFTGRNIHPAIAKDRMVNALRAASEFVASLPRDRQAPEVTDGRDGFVHPYHFEGGVGRAEVRLLLRSFDTAELERQAAEVRAAVDRTQQAFPGLDCQIEVTRQYRNLKEGLQKLPEAVQLARQAMLNLGRKCEETIIRGGTDGSQLTEKGLPTPNLSSGQHNIHSLHEFASLDEMVAAVEHLVELLRLWKTEY
ncbi:peptidase T [Candidatus Laterigemmans baculatus]|uniref:peptidase T n=1 Tax=Candidatus Laterigemmans baculatus TaxID=2770505 RepID=UPI0013DD43D2|nr:peptidase T [Candidatus Laterigemmans baculatus]